MHSRSIAVLRSHRALPAFAVSLAAALLFAACASTAAPTPTPQPAGAPVGDSGSTLRAADFAVSGGYAAAGGGLHASGYGVAAGAPDIAVLSLGVEAIAPTVSAARDDAARAFDAIVDALRGAGVSDDDIRTTQFAIHPRYQYRTETPELVGFQVVNSLSVTLRDIDAAGRIVDLAVAAGGDLTRVNSVSFRIEDTAALERQARISALQDAVEKADLYAGQLGVSRGAVLSVSETSSDPFPLAIPESRLAFDSAASAPTEFFAGEFEVAVRVQVVFGIE